jgi:hypothetical protein
MKRQYAKQIPKEVPKAIRNVYVWKDQNQEMAATWYFLAWHEKLADWPLGKRKRYAKQVSMITDIIPITLSIRPPDNAAKLFKERGITLFTAKDGLYVMLDKDGRPLATMTGTKLFALFAYLVDSLAINGLDEMHGFEWVKLAKNVIRRDSNAKKAT